MFHVTDVLPARIMAFEARPVLAKCGGAKYRRRRNPIMVASSFNLLSTGFNFF